MNYERRRDIVVFEMTNREIGALMKEIARMMEINGENKFKVRAYNNASRRIGELKDDLNYIVKEDKLESISGIGKGIAATIKELFEKGYSPLLEEIREAIPEGIIELINIPGLGSKRVHYLYKKLKISNIDELKLALKEEKIRELKGFGEKSEKNLLEAVQDYEYYSQVHILYMALLKSEELKELLESSGVVKRIETAGSVRRRKEIIADIDILAMSDLNQELSDFFLELPFVKKVIAKGKKRNCIFTEDNFQVDLRIVNEDNYPAALQYFTGSKEHNLKMRKRAKDYGYKLNEYGLYKGDKKLKIKEETDIYHTLDMDYIIPELRENKGELEAAVEGNLPKSIKLTDIRGDLHIHSRYTDGAYTIEEIVYAARIRNYQYIGITDHSRSLRVAHGMSIATLLKQLDEIDRIQERYSDIKILKGIEVDIDYDGKLDYPDDILKKLDLVIASIHSGFNQSKEQITNRIIKAMENPYVNIIGHLRGRILKRRNPYCVDVDKLIKIAGETGTCLEINASPYRLDIDDIICRKAKDNGVKIAINTDSHHLSEFDNILLGVAVARRGWLEKDDVINTMERKELSRFLGKGK